jgi:hypothetical protein
MPQEPFMMRLCRALAALLLCLVPAVLACAQGTYQPKFKGDPARSDDEAAALGYMRNTVRAEKVYNRRHQHYATSLHDLIGQGSFTRRMVETDRGAYHVSFHAKKDGYALALTPKQFDANHRGFYADEDAKIRVEESKPAGPNSPVLK